MPLPDEKKLDSNAPHSKNPGHAYMRPFHTFVTWSLKYEYQFLNNGSLAASAMCRICWRWHDHAARRISTPKEGGLESSVHSSAAAATGTTHHQQWRH